MKILFVHFGTNRIAGSEIALLELLKCLKGRDAEPVLWCNASSMAELARGLGIPTYHDEFEFFFDYTSPRFSVKTYWAQARKGVQLVSDNRVDIILCNSAAPVQWMLPAAILKNVPLFAYIHGDYQRRSRYVLGLHLADQIIAVSASTAAPFIEDGMGSDRVAVVPNGFAFETLGHGDRTTLRAQLGISDQAIVGAMVGSLIRLKGHDIAFEALRVLNPLPNSFQFLVVGDGPDRGVLEKAAAGLPVHFIGQCSDVGAILRDAVDFIVVPSRREAFGRVIIEAAAFGKPAIGSSVGGIPEAIIDEVTGLLVATESPRALAGAIKRLIEDQQLRARLGAAAMTRARRDFDITLCADQMLERFHSALAASRTSAIARRLGPVTLRPYLHVLGARARTRASFRENDFAP